MKLKTDSPRLPTNAGGLRTQYMGNGAQVSYFVNPHTGRVEPFQTVYSRKPVTPAVAHIYPINPKLVVWLYIATGFVVFSFLAWLGGGK